MTMTDDSTPVELTRTPAPYRWSTMFEAIDAFAEMTKRHIHEGEAFFNDTEVRVTGVHGAEGGAVSVWIDGSVIFVHDDLAPLDAFIAFLRQVREHYVNDPVPTMGMLADEEPGEDLYTQRNATQLQRLRAGR